MPTPLLFNAQSSKNKSYAPRVFDFGPFPISLSLLRCKFPNMTLALRIYKIKYLVLFCMTFTSYNTDDFMIWKLRTKQQGKTTSDSRSWGLLIIFLTSFLPLLLQYDRTRGQKSWVLSPLILEPS